MTEQKLPEITFTEKEQKIFDVLFSYGGIDGAHHKDWCIDQVFRILLQDKYEDFVKHYKAGDDGPDTYSYDEGIAP